MSSYYNERCPRFYRVWRLFIGFGTLIKAFEKGLCSIFVDNHFDRDNLVDEGQFCWQIVFFWGKHIQGGGLSKTTWFESLIIAQHVGQNRPPWSVGSNTCLGSCVWRCGLWRISWHFVFCAKFDYDDQKRGLCKYTRHIHWSQKLWNSRKLRIHNSAGLLN